MKEKKWNIKMRAIAWLLAFLMVIGLIPSNTMTVAAAEGAQQEETGISLTTTLTDNLTVKGRRKIFDVWARDAAGNTIHPNVTLDGSTLSPTWQDNVKTSFTLDFQKLSEGAHEVIISAADGTDTKSLTYKINYVPAKEGEFIGYATVSIEAFTISKGYIVEPVLMPIYEGDNAAKAFVELIREEGYDVNYTGSITSGFYLSSIVGSNSSRPKNATKELNLDDVALESHIAELIPSIANSFDPTMGSVGSLGEFDYNYMSGWMYCVNTVFPNVGFADYYLSAGDVMRAQFTVGYGSEIGGSSGMGGGLDDEYAVGNKDALTTTLAYINSAPNAVELKKNTAIAEKIAATHTVLENIVATQTEIDKANEELKKLLSGTVTGITLDKSELTLDNGKTAELTANVSVTGTPAVPIEWTSSNINAVTVKNGKVTAVGSGTSVITAKCGDYSATCTVTVPSNSITGITLDAAKLSLNKGKTQALTATITPANTTEDTTITWTSSDETVATVNEKGKISALKAGTSVITAQVGSFKAECKLTVVEIPMTGVKLKYYTRSLQAGKSLYLSRTLIPSDTTDSTSGSWASSDTSVATVSTSGTVKGVSAGTTTITYTSVNGFSASCLVVVQDTAPMNTSSITISETAVTLEPGNTTKTLTADVSGATDPIMWTSDNTEVVKVENGVLTAVGVGTANVTVYSGNKSASCKVTVKAALADVAFYAGTYSTVSTDKYKMSPEFKADAYTYTLYIPDSIGSFYLAATLPENVEGNIQASFVNYYGSDINSTLTSGKTLYLSQLVRAGSLEGNTLNVIATIGGIKATYTIKVVRVASMSSLNVSLDSQRLQLDPVFNSAIDKYTVTVPASVKKAYIEASGRDSSYQIAINGVSKESGTKQAITLKEDTIVSLEVTGDKGKSGVYQIHFVKAADAKLTFKTEPVDAAVSIKDADGNKVTPSNRVYTLLAGEEYNYSVVCGGYISVSDVISIKEDTEKSIKLEKVAENTLKDVSSAWKNFRNSDVNMGISSAKTPTDTASTYKKWNVRLSSGWSAAPSVQIIVDNALIVMSGSTIYKLDLQTGDVLDQGLMAGAPSYGYTPPTYANGMIFAPLGGGRVQAFNAETLDSLWVYQDELGGQALSPITYADGYVYTGFWNAETKEANYACISVTDEDPTEANENKLAIWTYTSMGGFYWAGSYVHGDYVIFGTDDGTSGSTGASKLLSVHRLTGEVKDSVDLIGDQRSTIAYDSATKSVWFTTKAGYLYNVGLNEDGTFNHSSVRSIQAGGMSTSTPVVYKGRVYIGVTSGGNFSGKYGVAVIDAAKMEQIYQAELPGYPQCSVLLSTAYEDAEGYIYLYSTYNNYPGGIALIKDKAGQTEPIIEDIYVPESALQQYCITSVICGEDGTLYYKNDSTNVIAIAKTTAYLQDVVADDCSLDKGTTFDGTLESHTIVTTSDAKKAIIRFKASEGSRITINKETITDTYEVEVGNEAVVIPVTVTNGKDSRTYSFTVRRASTDATLSKLMVNASNAYSGALNLSPTFSAKETEYTVEYSSTKSFLNVWPDLADNNAVYKVYPISIGSSTVVKDDGTILYTSQQSGHNRYAIYFGNADCAKVRVEVTAEDGKTVNNYYVTIKQAADNAPVLSEGKSRRISDTSASITFNANEYGSVYYEIKKAGEVAPETLDTSAEGTTVKVGENTITFDNLTAEGYVVYLAMKDTDSSAKISETISIIIPSTADNLAAAKAAAVAELEAYKNTDDYREEQQTELTAAVTAGKTAIEAAATEDTVQSELTAAKEALDAIKTAEQLTEEENLAAVAAVESKIAAIGAVTLESVASITEAREAYDALIEELKERINNLTVLTNAENAYQELVKADETEKQLAQVKKDAVSELENSVTLENHTETGKAAIQKAITEGKTAIDAAKDTEAVAEALKAAKADVLEKVLADIELLNQQKNQAESEKAQAESKKAQAESEKAQAESDKVQLEQEKEALKKAMDQAAANSIKKAIVAIGEVTLESKGVVEAARAGYDSLTENQKALVDNLAVLTAAEERVKVLEKAAEDQKAENQKQEEKENQLSAEAKPVEDAIAAIGTVTSDSKQAIANARAAYEVLSDEAKAKVSNLAILVIAEKDLSVIEAKALTEADLEKEVKATLATPKIKRVIRKGKKAVVKWSKVKGADGYVVYYRMSKKGKWKVLKQIDKGTKTKVTQKNLKKGKNYSYKVCAYRKVGSKLVMGSLSKSKSVKIKK